MAHSVTPVTLRIQIAADAPTISRSTVPVLTECHAAMMPGVYLPQITEFQECPVAMPVVKVARLETRNMAELKREVPVTELEHETRASEVPRLEARMLAEEVAVKIEPMVWPVNFCAGVR